MTEILLLTLALFGICMAGIAIGAMFGRPVKGSCGGLAANGTITRGGDESCSICGGDPNKCDAEQEEPQHYSKLQQALQKSRLM